MEPPKKPGRFHAFVGRDLPWLVEAQARIHPDKTFLIWDPGDESERRWSYQQFLQDVLIHATWLQRQGLRQHDTIVLHMDNSPTFLLVWYACAFIGALSVTTNTHWSDRELAAAVRASGATSAMTDPKYLDKVATAGPGLRWVALTGDHEQSSAHPCGIDVRLRDLTAPSMEYVPRAPEPLLPLSVQFTSGTTASPKGVVTTHANGLWCARVTSANLLLQDDDIHIVYFPLFHASALTYSILSTLWVGGTVVLLRAFDASRFWECSLRHRCTWANHLLYTLRALEATPAPEHHYFRFWFAVGENNSNVRTRWSVPTIGWFGMTETISYTIVSDRRFLEGPQFGMGLPAPEYEISVRDEGGREIELGQVGRLWIRGIPGVSLFAGYLNDPEATAAAFDPEGWFDTGDNVLALSNGHFLYSSRTADSLKVGGESVSPAEVEFVIRTISRVLDVAVIGQPNRFLGEVPIALVVADTPDEVLKQAIFTVCREHLADFKRPADVIFTEPFPKGFLGKTLKRELRKRFLDGSSVMTGKEQDSEPGTTARGE